MKSYESKRMPPKICLSIAGLDPSGGAGILADIKTFSALGCYGAAVATSVTFQNTVGVFGAVHQTAASVLKQSRAVLDDLDVAAIKTGMLPTRAIINTVAELAAERKFDRFVVDPVVRSTSGYDLIDDSALRSLIERLFPVADVITPNLQEAERIAGMQIKKERDIETAARSMLSMGAANVLIKGGHFYANVRKGKAIDYLFSVGRIDTFESEYIKTTATHGTGCTLASAIAAGLASGQDLSLAVANAKRFVTEAIRSAPAIGRGHSPIDHLVNTR